MHSCLYFICPTDHLETVIDSSFKGKNYFYTSLGNSITFDKDMVEQISDLIEMRSIREISFILSGDNKVIMDALEKQSFSEIKGLGSMYSEVVSQKKYSEVLWTMESIHSSIISHLLQGRIKELQLVLKGWFVHLLDVNAKVYNREQNTFHQIHPELTHLEYFSLN